MPRNGRRDLIRRLEVKQQVPSKRCWQPTNLRHRHNHHHHHHRRRRHLAVMELGHLFDPFRPLTSRSPFKSFPWFFQPFDVFGLTLLWACNPFRGNSHHSQVSRTYVMVRIKDIIILISSLVKTSSFRGYYCYIPSSSSSNQKYTHDLIGKPEGKKKCLEDQGVDERKIQTGYWI